MKRFVIRKLYRYIGRISGISLSESSQEIRSAVNFQVRYSSVEHHREKERKGTERNGKKRKAEEKKKGKKEHVYLIPGQCVKEFRVSVVLGVGLDS